MKSIFFAIIALFSSVISFGQYFTDMEWQKEKIPAIQVSVPYSQQIAEDAIRLEMGKLGYTPSSEKGGLIYKSVRIADIGPDAYDIIFKIQKKGRRENESADIFLAVSRGNNNYVQPNDTDNLPASVKLFSGRFVAWTEAQALEVEIKTQDEKVKSAQKKLQSLTDEGIQLEKKLQKINQDINDNKQSIEKQRTEVDIQAKALEALMKKRKN
jgi:hypothetical protein